MAPAAQRDANPAQLAQPVATKIPIMQTKLTKKKDNFIRQKNNTNIRKSIRIDQNNNPEPHAKYQSSCLPYWLRLPANCYDQCMAKYSAEKIKIALYFAQLQAKKNMQHQTKQAQFSIWFILEDSCSRVVALTVFIAQSRGYASIRGRATRGGHLAFSVVEFRVFTRISVGISPPLRHKNK